MVDNKVWLSIEYLIDFVKYIATMKQVVAELHAHTTTDEKLDSILGTRAAFSLLYCLTVKGAVPPVLARKAKALLLFRRRQLIVFCDRT